MNGIISYAQNFEDVMLWRALGHIENGFYIDIGAQDPLIDSVSLAFHEHGWRGIHVEPTPHYAELLRQQRPGDTVIQAAVGNGPALLTFFEIPDTGISTADPVIAQQHRERGFDVHEITVPCITLAAIFDSCPVSEIHWLKIDVEGFEQQVLSSWGTSELRPWIIVVESTLPLTQIETHEKWEGILIGYGYSPVYFDGLNRYYVSSTHPGLKDAFRSPPNVFDGFTLNGTASTTFHHLIDARYQQKISESIAKNEQQKLGFAQETERLTQSLTDLEQKYAEQTSQIRQELESLLRAQAQREQEFTAQLLTIQQRAEAEKTELTQQHQAHLQEMQRQHAEHEWLAAERIQQLNNSLQQLQTDAVAREQHHAENTAALQAELAELLRAQAQREQEFTAQLLTIQQRAEAEKTELTQQHQAHLQEMQRQHAEHEWLAAERIQQLNNSLQQLQTDAVAREQHHAENTAALQAELAELLRAQAQREQEFTAQLLTIQQRAEAEKTELTQQHQAHLQEMQRQHAEHEWLAAERIQQLNNSLQQLQIQIAAEQQTSLQLRHALSNVQQRLAATHATFSWRITAPLRALASIVTRKKNFTDAFALTGEVMPPDATMPAIHITQSASEPAISVPHTMTITTPHAKPMIASTLDELMALHDQPFIDSAYQTLLGRAPDPEGQHHYLNRLRTGIAKIQILMELRSSSEGRAFQATLPNLDSAIRRYKKTKWPLIGWLFADKRSRVERKLRVIENQIVVFSDENNRRLNQIETSLAGLHHLLGQQRQVADPTLGEVPVPVQPPEPEGIKQLTPRARDIYFQLKAATLTGR